MNWFQQNWKRVATYGAISLASLMVLGYGLLFTRIGNSIMSSYVEYLLNTDPKVPVKVDNFYMDTDEVKMSLKISNVIDTQVHGAYSLFGGHFDGEYLLHVNDLSKINLEQLKELKAKGAFETKGVIQSTHEGYKVLGVSELFGGDVNYTLFFINKELKEALFNISNLSLQSIANASGGKSMIDGALHVEGKITDVREGKLAGVIVSKLDKVSLLDTKALEMTYGVKAPQNLNLNATSTITLKGTKALVTSTLITDLVRLEMQDVEVDFTTQEVHGAYILQSANMKNLLQQSGLTHALGDKLTVDDDTKISLHGKFKSDKTLDKVLVDGESDFLGGKIRFWYDSDVLNVNVTNVGYQLSGVTQLAHTSKLNANVDYYPKHERYDFVMNLEQGDSLLEVKKGKIDIQKNSVDAHIAFKAAQKNMEFFLTGYADNPDIVLKGNEPLLSQSYRTFLNKEIDANIKDATQKAELEKLLTLLSRKEGTLKAEDAKAIEKSLEALVAELKKEYEKVKNVRFSKEHLENLHAMSEKIRQERLNISDADLKDVQKRAQKAVEDIKKEWNSEVNQVQRERALKVFNTLGSELSKQGSFDEKRYAALNKEFNNAIDAYQTTITNKKAVEKELQKYDALVKVFQAFDKKQTYKKENVYAILEEFSALLELMQYKITQTDIESEYIFAIKEMSGALQKQSTSLMKKSTL